MVFNKAIPLDVQKAVAASPLFKLLEEKVELVEIVDCRFEGGLPLIEDAVLQVIVHGVWPAIKGGLNGAFELRLDPMILSRTGEDAEDIVYHRLQTIILDYWNQTRS